MGRACSINNSSNLAAWQYKSVDWRRDCVQETIYDDLALWRSCFPYFCHHNMHVIDAVTEECRKLKNAGRVRYSMRTIIEVLRHNSAIRQAGDVTFKINDHAAPDLARLVMILFPAELDGFFELRGRK